MFWRIRNYFDKYERVMRKQRKFYNKPKAEETYALDYSICEFLIPRLRLYIDKADQVVVKDFTKVEKIIIALQTYVDYHNNDCSDFRAEAEEWKRVKPILDEGLRLLAEEFTTLGW